MNILNFIIRLMIVLIPFSMAISPAPMHSFSGALVFFFILKKIIKRERLFADSSVALPFVVFFIVSAVSVFNSVNFQDSLRGLIRLGNYFLTFIIITQELKDKRHVWLVCFSLILGACLVSVDAIWQVATGKDFIRGNLPILNMGLNRATASFSDANVLGVYLSAIVPVAIALALYYFKGKKRLIALASSFLIILGLLLTYSRPTILALFISLVIFGFVKRDKVVLFSLLILGALSPILAPSGVKEWAKQVNYNPVRFMCNDDRIAVYFHSLNMIKSHPVIGVGVNTYMKNYKQYKVYPEYRNVVTPDNMYAHNNFLQMAAEVGLLGLGVFLWLIYKIFACSVRIYRRLDDLFVKNISLAFIVCLAAFLINGLTESSFYYSRVALIFWYLVGCSLALRNFVRNEAA